MVWLPYGEKNSKISLFVLAQLTNVTDGQTDTACRHIMRLCIASRGKNRAVGTLKLTTDKHEVSSGLSATAELLVTVSTDCEALSTSLPPDLNIAVPVIIAHICHDFVRVIYGLI